MVPSGLWNSSCFTRCPKNNIKNNPHVYHILENKKKTPVSANDELQLSFFQLDDPVLSQVKKEITKIDIDTLTPIEALMKLNEIKKLVGG